MLDKFETLCIFILFSNQENQEECLQSVAESCFRFTPQVAVRSPNVVFLEIGGSKKLFNRDFLVLKIKSLLTRFSLPARIAIDANPSTALACADFGCASFMELPLEAIAYYGNVFFQNDDFQKKADQFVEAFKGLGISRISEIKGLPTSSLTARFGAEIQEILDQIEDPRRHIWPRYRIEEELKETFDFQDEGFERSSQSLEEIWFYLKRILDRITLRLSGRAKRASLIELDFKLENYSNIHEINRKFEFDFPVPQGSTFGILPILRDRLDGEFQERPLEAPIVAVTVRVLEMAPGRGLQKDFFTQEENKKELWDAFIARFCTKLGMGSAFYAREKESFVPEKAWEAALEEKKKKKKEKRSESFLLKKETQKDPLPKRPTRLLSSPKKLKRQGKWIFHPLRPEAWEVGFLVGPERLVMDWWEQTPEESIDEGVRDYYVVITKTGERLWVYYTPLSREKGECFLHGYFD